ncbi:MAG: Ig-like domain-containing protein [Dehalococcoidales bacterium]|nr:Ig-like domain-containing protein [Dehalococcoidales bacterium]
MNIKLKGICGILNTFMLLLSLTVTPIPLNAQEGLVDLVITPATLDISRGEIFTLTVEAQCGEQTIDGIDVFLDFDPDCLAVQSAEKGTTLSTALKEASWDNERGTFDISAGKLTAPFPSGTFEVVSITFQALNNTVASTPVDFSTSVARTTLADWSGKDITGILSGGSYNIKSDEALVDLVINPPDLDVRPGETFNITVKAICGSQTIDGIDVFLDFNPEYLAVRSAEKGTALTTVLKEASWDNEAGTFDFSTGKLTAPFPSGTFEVTSITFQALNNTVAETPVDFSTSVERTTIADCFGEDITGILSGGSYNIKDAGKGLTSISIAPVTASIPMGKTQQFTAIPLYSDGSSTPLPEITWSSSDSDTVSINSSSGLAKAVSPGDAPVTITASYGDISDTSTLSVMPLVDLVILPDAQTLVEGEPLTITVEARCGSQTIHGIDVFLDFDPECLAVQSADSGEILSTVLTEASWDNEAGTFDFGAGQLASPFPSGTFDVVSVTFQAIKSTVTSTPVSFSTSVKRTTTVDWSGQDITGTISGGNYTILAIPVVESISPEDGAKGVSLSSSIVITFNKEMSRAVTENAFSVSPEVTGSFNWNSEGSEMTFDPAGNLDKSTTYTVGVGTSAVDTDGIHMAEAFSSVFTTTSGGSSGGGGGGGGGGGAAVIVLSGFENNSPLSIYDSGVIKDEAILTTMDGRLKLEISKGTQLWNSSNSALTSLKAMPVDSPPEAPEGKMVVLAYDLGLDGAMFDPAIKLTITYNPASLNSKISESDLYLAWFDGSQWQELAQADIKTHSASAGISHFTCFALIGKISQPPATTTTRSTYTPSPAAEPAATTPVKSTPTAAVPAVTTTVPAIPSPEKATPPVTKNNASTPAATSVSVEPGTGTPWGLIGGIIGGIIAAALIVVIIRNRIRNKRD